MSVRRRKRALWVATGVAWSVAFGSVGMALQYPEVTDWRTLTILTLTIAATLFSTSAISSLIQAPDVAYRIGVEHGRAGTCDRCRQSVMTGTNDAVVLQFRTQHTDN